MSLSLVLLPREILAKITSSLSTLDIVMRLYGCGDSTLTARLKTGGVTSLTHSGSVLPQSRIDFIKSLQLDSFTINTAGVPTAFCQQLIQGLLPSLRRLNVTGCFASDIMQIYFSPPDGNFQPLPLPVQPYEAPAWIVRNAYPRLETLRIDKEPQEPFLIVEFLAGLPDTLVYLSFSDSASDFVNALSILPPNLSHLKLTGGLAMAARFRNMSSMDVIASTPKDQLLSNLGRWSKSTLKPFSFGEDRIPPSITSLDLDCSWANFTESAHSYPPHLEVLHLRGSTSLDRCTVGQFFNTFPRSITEVHLHSWTTFLTHDSTGTTDINRAGAPSTSAQRGFVLPSLKLLELFILPQNAHVYSEIIAVVPNVEVFNLQTFCSTLLGLDHIRLFNGALLRDLRAAIDMTCFVRDSDGTYPLATILPNLATLYLIAQPDGNATAELFDFGAIPPSVTEFNSFMKNHTSTTLHLLPPSVTSIQLRYVATVLIENENFDQLFRSPTPSSSASGDANAPDMTSCICLNVSLRSYLHRRGDGRIYCSETKSEGSLGCLQWQWPRSLPFELLLGCSEVTIIDDVKIADPLDDTRLPDLSSLTKLSLFGKNNPSWLNLDLLETMESLVDLSISGFGELDSPLNLTRLTCYSDSLPSYLPHTLTSLECPGLIPSMLSGLKLLEELILSDSDAVDIFFDWRGAIPTSVTKLRLAWHHLYTSSDQCWSRADLSKHLFDRLPSLKHMTVGRMVPHPLIEALCDVNPSHVVLKMLYIANSPPPNVPLIAKRAGLSHGDLQLLPCENIAEAFIRMIRHAYRRFNLRPYGSIHQPDKKLLNWPSFCPFLATNTSQLEVLDLYALLDDNGELCLPPAITALICASLSRSCAKPIRLPLQIRKLVISSPMPNLSIEKDLILPPGLNHLDIMRLKILNPSFAWPSNLTFLRISFLPRDLREGLMALPSSLRHLLLDQPTLQASLFSSLPQGLKLFDGAVVLEDCDAFVEHAKSVGLTWIMRPQEMIRLLRNFNLESSLDMLAARPSTN